MMNTRVCLGLALCGLLAGLSTGCSSTPIVARGQNALPEPFVVPAGYGAQPELSDVVHDTFHHTKIDHYNVPANNPHQPVPANWHHLPTNASLAGLHGGAPAQACPPGGACPQCPPSADCPHCKGHPSGAACPFCQNSTGAGGHLHGAFGGAYNHLRGPYPKHHFTYAYKRPHNLQYPPPQVPGGVVVYPYYTLKGPSDFFRE